MLSKKLIIYCVTGSIQLFFHYFLKMYHNAPDAVPLPLVDTKSNVCKKAILVSVVIGIFVAYFKLALHLDHPVKDSNGCHGSPLMNWRCDRNFSCQRFEDCPNYEDIYVRIEDHRDIYYAKAARIGHVIIYGKDDNCVCLDSMGSIVQGNINRINPNNINICEALLYFEYSHRDRSRLYLSLNAIYPYDKLYK
ncbi:MAG: hypothetical protein Hyperionvirus28_11 [Hyperionvirus sp.]|uniref:Uncharacterized protein n=1 Tax=Hyperionvirus sp. TaxID=2487770 RepID=A0A3G5AF63_9VIRU|nr:MAG: hypothetical protein Hyperionvirus28_11 [Hyperionvirus sp.]